ncbi:MAG TPA: DUF6603 domain-containing protein [Longimicrobiales bacterium]
MTGEEIRTKVEGHIADGTLRLGTGSDIGSPGVDRMLDTFFGGTLTAVPGEPQVLDTKEVYADASLKTAGFTLYGGADAVPAELTFSDPGDGTIQLAVEVDMPAGYRFGDSFASLEGPGSPLGALRLSRATFTLDSTLDEKTVRFQSAVRLDDGLLEPVSWLFGDAPTLRGTLVLARTPAGTVYPELELTSDVLRSPNVSGFGLSFALTVRSRALAADQAAEPRVIALAELTATLTTSGLTLPVVITLQPGAKALPVRLDTLAPAPAITGLGQLAGLAGGQDPSGLISADTPIGTLSLDWASLVLDLETREIRDVQIAVRLGTDWTIVDRLELAGLKAVFHIPSPHDAKSVSVAVTAEIEAGETVLDATVRYPEKEVDVQLAPGSVVDVETFLQLFAPGASLPGRSDFAIVTFDLRADVGRGTYALACEADGRLEILPTFTVDRLSFEARYGQGALQEIAFGCLFSIAKTELYLSAAYGGDGWLLAGGTYQGSGIDLSDVVSDVATIFGVELPTELPEIVLADLQLTRYATSDGSFAFQAEIDYFGGDDALLKSITGKVDIAAGAVDEATQKRPWTGGVSGSVVIGESRFTVAYDFRQSKTLTCSWQAEGDETFGIASLCEMLGLPSPEIPEGLDLGLKRVAFTYDLTAKSLLLSADSANYGKAVFVTRTLGTTRVYAFGIDVPIDVRLSDIPLVGDKIPEGDQLGIHDMGVWLLSQPLTKAEVGELNETLRTLSGYPTLPDRDIGTRAMLFGALQLGRDTVPLDLPLGATGPAPESNGTAGGATAAGAAGGAAGAGGTAVATTETGTGVVPAGGDGTRWIDVQRTFGIFSFRRIGVRYDSDGGALFIALDASIALGPVTFSLDGLALGSPLTKFEPKFHLSGLGLAYAQPPLEIAGALLAVPGRQLAPETAFQYDGVAVVKAENFSLSAIGSYAQLVSGDPSLFVFAQLESPLGGPPAFFVLGLMAGFGFNRSLALPAQDEVQGFPLLVLAQPPAPGQNAPSQDPMKVLDILEGRAPVKPGGTPRRWIAPSPGDTWLAIGLEFTSFELVRSKALLIAEFGDELSFALLGLSTVQLPVPAEGAPTYAYAELQLDAVLRPTEGFFGLSAVLTPSSFVLTQECRLTGGFAFYLWFGENEHAGQFVVTLGGYHPAFKRPSYFPTEPRLGINWAVSDRVTIKGGAYFALTPSCAMAGGGLEALYHGGDVRAWFTANADLLVSWRPFFFTARIAVSIGASYRLNLGVCHKTVSVSVGASVELWGPPTGGKVRVDLPIVSFTVRFGSSGASANDAPLPWSDFSSLLPHPDAVCRITPSDGLYKTRESETSSSGKEWIVRARRFRFFTQSAIPAGRLRYGDAAPEPTALAAAPGGGAADGSAGAAALAVDDGDGTVDVRPMDRTGVVSTHRLRIFRGDETNPVDVSGWTLTPRRTNVPASLWGAPPSPFTQIPDRPSAEVLADRLVGYDVAAPAPVLGASLGLVPREALAEEYLSPQGRAPIAADAAPSPAFVPRFEPTSVAAIARIAGAEATAARGALHAALVAAGLYDGANGSLDVLARDAAHLYSDPPMVQP